MLQHILYFIILFFQMIVGSMPCPLYLKEKRNVNEELSVKYDIENSDLYKYLSEHTGLNITSILDVESIYNILEIQVRNYKKPHLLIIIVLWQSHCTCTTSICSII